MVRRCLLKPGLLVSVALMVSLMLAVACGGSAPAAEQPSKAAEVTVPDTPAPATEVAPVATSTPTPLIVPVSTTMEFPLVPDWVANGKYQPMVLQFVSRSNPGQWDTHYCGSLFSCAIATSPRFNQLVEYNPVNPTEIIGDLAKSWEINEDGTEYIFKIHDATWHDGKPVTAEDIVFSFDRIVEPDAIRNRTAALKDFYVHKTAEVVDANTVKIPLKFPAATFLTTIAVDYYAMYPKHIAEGKSQDDINCCPANLIGSGPWIFKNNQPKISWEHEKNPNYFKTGRPYFDGIKFNHIRDVGRLLTALQVGQVDLTDGLAPTYANNVTRPVNADTKGRVQLHRLPGGSGKFIIFTNTPPFDDLRVRRAIFLAIDRQEVVDVVYCRKEGCDADVGTFFQVNKVEKQDQLTNVPGYRIPKAPDIAEAKALMAEAGFPDGFKADINSGNSPAALQVGEIVTEQLRASLGVDLTLVPADTATYHVRIQENTYPITLVSGFGLLINDPSDVLNQVYAFDVEKNPDNWTAPRFAELVASQISELNPEKRLGQFEEMVDILRKAEGHWVPIVWEAMGGAHDYRIQNYVVPQTIQQVLKWDHIWWDPNAVCPDPAGCEQ